jgi:hypothetical protein
MHNQFRKDLHPDAGRQVYSADGWWTWSVNLIAGAVVSGEDPTEWPNEYSGQIAWRHGKNKNAAHVLYRDSHVAPIIPRRGGGSDFNPAADTVDTVESFMWLPGESPGRNPFSPYSKAVLGERTWNRGIKEFSGKKAKGTFPEYKTAAEDGRAINITSNPGSYNPSGELPVDESLGPQNYHPSNFPLELSALYRSVERLWVRLPNLGDRIRN